MRAFLAALAVLTLAGCAPRSGGYSQPYSVPYAGPMPYIEPMHTQPVYQMPVQQRLRTTCYTVGNTTTCY